MLGATLLAARLAAARTAYTSEAAFIAATAGRSFAFAIPRIVAGGPYGNLPGLGDVTFSCTGTNSCPGFFGRLIGPVATDGSYFIEFATPDTAVFTFASAITAFSIDVIGLGDVGATNFFANIGTGPLALQQNYTGSTFNVAFAGVTSATPFTTVTFTGSVPRDGIFFDRLRYSTAPAVTSGVPEPASWAMMIGGFALAGQAMRRRRRAVAAV